MFHLEQLEDLDQPLLGQNLDEFCLNSKGIWFFGCLGNIIRHDMGKQTWSNSRRRCELPTCNVHTSWFQNISTVNWCQGENIIRVKNFIGHSIKTLDLNINTYIHVHICAYIHTYTWILQGCKKLCPLNQPLKNRPVLPEIWGPLGGY